VTKKFNFVDALQVIQSGQTIKGKDGVFVPLMKQFLETALEAELESHRAGDVLFNRKIGKTNKTIRSSVDRIDPNTRRDRAAIIEPEIVKKQQTSISGKTESKILSMCNRDISYSDIGEHVCEIYGMSVSTAEISATTGKIIDNVQAWQRKRWTLIILSISWMSHTKKRATRVIIKVAIFVPFLD